MRKLALYGTAGSGKSTVAAAISDRLTEHGVTVEVVKLAAPLYAVQGHLYATAGRDIGAFEHDNEVLRTVAGWLRRINPDCIVDDFLARVHASKAAVVVNDDLRDTATDYPRMAADGFAFVHVSCADDVRRQRLAARGDRTAVPDSDDTWGYHRIVPNHTVDTTTGDRDDLRHQVDAFVTTWLSDTGG